MNPFDLGVEVFILPILWAILAAIVIGTLKTSITRHKTIVEDEDTGELLHTKTDWHINKKRTRAAGITAVVGGLILASVVVVPPGHRGAEYTTSGVSLTEIQEGYSLIPPVIHNVNMVNVREQVYETIYPKGHENEGKPNLFAQTRDLLEVTMQVGVNYHIDPDKAADIFRDVGQAYERDIIQPAVQQIAKKQAGLIDAIDFPTARQKLADAIYSDLRARLAPVGITVTFVAIEDAIFAPEFVDAVLAKEIADEKAIESERLVTVAKNEAQQVRERADGEAYAINEVQSSLLSAPEYLEYLRLQKWDGILPDTLLGGGEDIIVDLP